MQRVSKTYKTEIKKPYRNKGHIKAWIGVINSQAQHAVEFGDSRNEFADFSNVDAVLNNEPVNRPYATFEENYSKVDGSFYFIPLEGEYTYNQGIATEELVGTIYVTFGGQTGFDIKGLTIDFGVCYPTRLRISNGNESYEYTNDKQVFITEDAFDNTPYFIIEALEMVGGLERLRIVSFTCGIANIFGNKETEEFFFKDYSSTLSDSIPSHDLTLTVNNRNLYYSPDNPDSALAYLEQGQIVEVSFGYEIDENGTIEWVNPVRTYLKQWSANDTNAKFQAVDKFFFQLGDTFYDGLYMEQGISLFDLAEEVFADGGLSSNEYYIDPYLKKVVVQNPLPVTTHANCIQIIANAGRCSLLLERGNRICIKSQFIPDSTLSVNNKTSYSKLNHLLDDSPKTAYAEFSDGYSLADESMRFMSRGGIVGETGYISESIYINDQWVGEVPKITVDFESAWVFYGLIIKFRNIAPEEFQIEYYKDGAFVSSTVVTGSELTYESFDMSPETDQLVITFTKGSPNARVFVDSILINDVTDYHIMRHGDLRENAPTGIRQNRIQSISVKRHVYRRPSEGKTLVNGESDLPAGQTIERVNFPKPSYGFSVSISEGSATATIIRSSSHYADIQFTTSVANKVKYAVNGYEFIVDEPIFIKKLRVFGEAITWDNPLISGTEHASDMEEWLESYYLGDVDYSLDWRGDPCVDANDLFYLELKERDMALIRAYQSELNFNGAWRGHLKARKAVVSWR